MMLTSYGNGSMAMDLYREYQQEAYEDLMDVCDLCGCTHAERVCPCCGGPEAVETALKADLTFKLAHRPRPNPARLGLYLATLRTIFPG